MLVNCWSFRTKIHVLIHVLMKLRLKFISHSQLRKTAHKATIQSEHLQCRNQCFFKPKEFKIKIPFNMNNNECVLIGSPNGSFKGHLPRTVRTNTGVVETVGQSKTCRECLERLHHQLLFAKALHAYSKRISSFLHNVPQCSLATQLNNLMKRQLCSYLGSSSNLMLFISDLKERWCDHCL